MKIIKKIKDFFLFKLDDPLFSESFLNPLGSHAQEPRFENVYRLSYNPNKSVQVDVFVNGESVKTSLTAREIYLSEHSRKERQAREQAMILAMERGEILSKEVAFVLRKAEEDKRLEAYQHILDMKRAARQHDSD